MNTESVAAAEVCCIIHSLVNPVYQIAAIKTETLVYIATYITLSPRQSTGCFAEVVLQSTLYADLFPVGKGERQTYSSAIYRGLGKTLSVFIVFECTLAVFILI